MPETPEYDWPYPIAGQADNVPYVMQQLAEAIEATVHGIETDNNSDHAGLLSQINALEPAGWVAIPAASGYTSSAECRIEQGDVVRLKGSIAKNSGNLVRATTVGTIPSGKRPASLKRAAGAITAGTTTPNTTSVWIATDGTIQLGGDATTLASGTTIYLDGITFDL